MSTSTERHATHRSPGSASISSESVSDSDTSSPPRTGTPNLNRIAAGENVAEMVSEDDSDMTDDDGRKNVKSGVSPKQTRQVSNKSNPNNNSSGSSVVNNRSNVGDSRKRGSSPAYSTRAASAKTDKEVETSDDDGAEFGARRNQGVSCQVGNIPGTNQPESTLTHRPRTHLRHEKTDYDNTDSSTKPSPMFKGKNVSVPQVKSKLNPVPGKKPSTDFKSEPKLSCSSSFWTCCFIVILCGIGAVWHFREFFSTTSPRSIKSLQLNFPEQPKYSYKFLGALHEEYQDPDLREPAVITIVDLRTKHYDDKAIECFLRQVGDVFAGCSGCTFVTNASEKITSIELETLIMSALSRSHSVVIRDFHLLSEGGLLVVRKFTDVHDPHAQPGVFVLGMGVGARGSDEYLSVERSARDALRTALQGKVVDDEVEPLLSRVAINLVPFIHSPTQTVPCP